MGNTMQKSTNIEKFSLTDQVNSLISQSNNDIMCGPACQEQKKLSGLEQKYTNAQTNLKTAPEQLKAAKKDYYLALDGQAKYNQMVLDNATKDATTVITSLQEKFDDTAKTTTNYIDIYESLVTNHNYMNELSDSYAEENHKMARILKKIRGDIITNDRKSYYEQQYIDGLENWYYWYRIIYILLIIIFIGLVIFKSTSTWIIKILLILFFVFYPLFITSVFVYFLKMFKYLIGFFPKYSKVRTV